MQGLKGLNDFCRKYKVPIPTGDQFNLLDFLLQLGSKTQKLAEYKGRITEVIARLGEESDDWGGCPRCGTNVHLGLNECPVCGLDLSAEEEQEKSEEDDLTELDPSYSEDKIEEVDDLDDLDSDSDEIDAEEESDNDSDDDDPLEDGFEEDEQAEDDVEEAEVDEFEEDEPEEEAKVESEPLVAAKASVQQKKIFQKQKEQKAPEEKVDPRKNMMSNSQKVRVRETRRQKLESLLPKFRSNPDLVEKLKYRDLLIMPGLLGFTQKPTMIGGKRTIQQWVKRALQKKGAKT